MPAGVLFLVILVSTTLEVLAERTRTVYREKLWRRTLQDHTIVCGYGVKGRAAIETLRAHGVAPDAIVVIDGRARRRSRRRAGPATPAIVGDASASTDARGGRGRARPPRSIVAPDRDDSAVLITLTARELNPRARIVASVREEENAHLLRRAARTPSSSPPAPPGGCSGTRSRARASSRCSRTCSRSARGSTSRSARSRPEEVGHPLGRCRVGRAGHRRGARRGGAAVRRRRGSATCRRGDRLVCLCTRRLADAHVHVVVVVRELARRPCAGRAGPGRGPVKT